MKIIGGLLLGIGILIAGVSGLCSLALLSESSTWSGPASGESLGIIAMIGGLPFLFGVGLVFLGRHLLRQAAPPTTTPQPPVVTPRNEAEPPQ
jgi:hypothetical protein